MNDRGEPAMDEVRFERMIPAQVVTRREACNLAYLPVGTLEWHGLHMPFGTDFLTVSAVAEEAAHSFGGLAFPALYYGDVRFRLHECRLEWRRGYTESMQVPREFPELFALQNSDGTYGYECPPPEEDGPMPERPLPFSKQQQTEAFEQLIAFVLLQIHLYGFRNIILLPGHVPHVEPCRNAIEIYRANVERCSRLGPPARAMSFMYIDAGAQSEPLLKNHWVHADKWEGSITMVAAPGTVHMERLPEDPDAIPPAYLGYPYTTENEGYLPEQRAIWHSFVALDPRNASEEYGKEQFAAVMEVLGKAIEEFMGGEEAAEDGR